MVIQSISNPKVKLLRSAFSKKGRAELGLFVVEGVNMVRDIPDQSIVEYYFVSEKKQSVLSSFAYNSQAEILVLTDELFERVSETVTPSGIIALCRLLALKDWHKAERLMILDGVSDPGNVGTIIRTAGAVGFDCVLLFNSADPYSPKCIRSTMGGIFRLSVVSLEYAEFDWENQVYLLDMNGTNIFEECPSERYAVVVGSEASGASDFFRKRADKVLSIPMKNHTESLNAGVSASLSMYILEHNRR